jgi:hypothetical protein
MTVRTVTAVLGLALLLGACDGGGTTDAASRATTTSEATTTTGASSTSTSTTAVTANGRPVTTTTPAVPCPLAPVPAGVTGVATRSGDFDGDRTADTLRAYKAGEDWHLRVELAGGNTGGDVVVSGVQPQTGLKPVGGFDIGGNKGDEAFAVVGSGASTDILGLFVFSGCTLIRVTAGGTPAELTVGASALNRSGVSCVLGTALQTLKATAPSDTGTPFAVVRSTYDLVGSVLRLANMSQATIAASDPGLTSSATLDCGRLSLS